MADEIVGDSGSASAAPAASAPASPAGTPAPSGASAPAPIAQGDGEGAPTPSGPIPFDRHKAILENTRKEYEERYAWAKDLTPDQVRTWRERHELIDRDPVRAYTVMGQFLQQHPVYGRYLSRPTAPETDAEPTPDLQAENGQPVFSAPQAKKWQEWNNRQWEAKLNERLQPLEHATTAQQQRDQALEQARRVIADLQSLPHFEELKPRIQALMKADGRTTPRSAYQAAYREWEADYESRVKKALADELRTKANAGSVNPSSPSTSTPADLKKLGWVGAARELFKQGVGRDH